MIGIYKIENLENGKVYIGQALDIESRWKNHKSGLYHNKHENTHLQRAWNKYGGENFKFEVIEECFEYKLTEREQYWIDYYGGLNSFNIYNQRDAGPKGRLSKESKIKLSKSQKGSKKAPRTVSPEGRKSLSVSHLGIKPTLDTRQKMSASHKANPHKHSEETKQLLSIKISKYYQEHPELRETISNRMKNRTVSEETKRKISISEKGKTYKDNKEQCKKHSEGLKRAYKGGKLMNKQKLITIYNITKNQTEWARFLDITTAAIIQAYKKDVDYGNNYIKEKFILKLLNLGILDNFVSDLVEQKGKLANLMIDEKLTVQNKANLVNFLLS